MSRSTRHHRGSAVVTLCVVRINTTEVTPSSKHPANVIRPFVANMQSISQKIIGGGDACILKPNDYFLAGRRPPQITKKTTALRQSSGELAGARTQDPNIKSVVLYLLSYEFIAPNHFWWCKGITFFLNAKINCNFFVNRLQLRTFCLSKE